MPFPGYIISQAKCVWVCTYTVNNKIIRTLKTTEYFNPFLDYFPTCGS